MRSAGAETAVADEPSVRARRTGAAGPHLCVEARARRLAATATRALVAEVRLTPKPGLVDLATTGAHADMDVGTFLASARALAPFFVAYARAGLAWPAATPLEGLVERLRVTGRAAEAAMFSATGGVNTHKGANFAFSLILAATGLELAAAGPGALDAARTARVLDRVSAMGGRILADDLARATARRVAGARLSHGERLLLEQGVTGARGEAAAGYPALARVLLPHLRRDAGAGRDGTEALLRAFVLLVATLEDTNLLHRGGAEGLAWARAQARALADASLGTSELTGRLTELDAAFTRRNLSPGGTADLLSLGIYFAELEGLGLEVPGTWGP